MLEEDGFDEGEPASMSNVYPNLDVFDNNPSETDITDLQVSQYIHCYEMY